MHRQILWRPGDAGPAAIASVVAVAPVMPNSVDAPEAVASQVTEQDGTKHVEAGAAEVKEQHVTKHAEAGAADVKVHDGTTHVEGGAAVAKAHGADKSFWGSWYFYRCYGYHSQVPLHFYIISPSLLVLGTKGSR